MDSDYNIELIRIGPGWSIREGAVEICYLPAASGWTEDKAELFCAIVKTASRMAYHLGFEDGTYCD